MSDWIDKLFESMEEGVSDEFRDALFYAMNNCQYTEDEQIELSEIIYSKDLTQEKAEAMYSRFLLNAKSFQEIANPSQKQITKHLKYISYNK